MGLLTWVREKYIYLLVIALFTLMGFVLYVFQAGRISTDAARVYVETLSAVATLTLLYFAYFNVASRRQEEIAHLELAVRPIFIWEVESSDSRAYLAYKAQKHPIYDLRILLSLRGELLKIDEGHLDVSDANPSAERKVDITKFVSKGLDGKEDSVLELEFSYHSEVGGRYEFRFTKEVLQKPKGFAIEHRKIASAKYPWRKEAVRFED